METSTIVAIICAIIGSGGISALVTAIISARKSNAEAKKIESEANGVDAQNKITNFEYINKRLQEISDNAANESEALRKRNDELNQQVNQLNNKLQVIMEWIIYDNQKYRNWLESELRKSNPDIQFPECPPPPKIFGNDEHHNEKK